MADATRTGVTILEVAAFANVSRQTVSNVLNAPERVAPETAARVRHAIDLLGYRPNRVARNLRARTSRLLGFRIDSPSGLSNLLDRFLHALADSAGAAGYHVLLFTPSSVDQEFATYEDLIRTGTVDGFVLAEVLVGDRRLAWLARHRIPFVCFGRPWGQERAGYPWVDVDGAFGTSRAVDYLVSRDHRRIAYLGWPPGTGYGDDREAGWREAMRRHGLPTDTLRGSCQEDAESAALVARRLLAQPDPPTGLVCGSDTFAVAARLAGGSDHDSRPRLDVVGFDDSPAARSLSPPLCSLRQPLVEVARHVIELLVQQFHDSAPPQDGVLLRPELVSCEPYAGPGTHTQDAAGDAGNDAGSDEKKP